MESIEREGVTDGLCTVVVALAIISVLLGVTLIYMSFRIDKLEHQLRLLLKTNTVQTF